ncbi:unnamed protein product [Meloidogyne enterolobii]|uniref:Uncharacterized protein n=1 Tax=Meloidogyne enterolobii TaxID=390850 RepID=A0ACB0Y6E9_MELEN
MIFDVPGATIKYKNLYRIIGVAISIPVSNAFIERIFSMASIQWTKERNSLEVKLSGLYFLCRRILTCHALKCTKCSAETRNY